MQGLNDCRESPESEADTRLEVQSSQSVEHQSEAAPVVGEHEIAEVDIRGTVGETEHCNEQWALHSVLVQNLYNLHLLAWQGNNGEDFKPGSQLPNLFSAGFFPSGRLLLKNHLHFPLYMYIVCIQQTLLDQDLVPKKLMLAAYHHWKGRPWRKSALTVFSSCPGMPSPGTSGTCTGLMQEWLD